MSISNLYKNSHSRNIMYVFFLPKWLIYRFGSFCARPGLFSCNVRPPESPFDITTWLQYFAKHFALSFLQIDRRFLLCSRTLCSINLFHSVKILDCFVLRNRNMTWIIRVRTRAIYPYLLTFLSTSHLSFRFLSSCLPVVINIHEDSTTINLCFQSPQICQPVHKTLRDSSTDITSTLHVYTDDDR